MSQRVRRWSRVGPGAPSRQLAVFTLGALRYGMDIMEIRQIVRPQRIRPVPAAPAFVDGVMDLRGQVIPVMDLRRRFGLLPDADTRASKIIIAEVGGRPLGLLVDRVLSVHRLRQEEIQPTPQWITGSAAGVFTGACVQEGHLVLILDLGLLLNLGEALHLQALELTSEERIEASARTSVPEGSSDERSRHG